MTVINKSLKKNANVGVGKCTESWTRAWVQDDWVIGQSCFGQESFYSTYASSKALGNSMILISSLGQSHLPLQPGARGISLFAY